MTTTISSLSTEYIRVPIRVREDGEFVDPTANVVEFAYAAAGDEPAEADWVTGAWETDAGRYYAKVLTGPDGDVDPGDGTWVLWARVTRTPAVPVRATGLVVIT